MPGHKIRLSLSSRFFSSSSTPTTPSSEDFPPTPRSHSITHKPRPSLSKFFGLSSTPASPTTPSLVDFSSKLRLEDGKVKAQPSTRAPCPIRRQTLPAHEGTPFYYNPGSHPRPLPRRAATALFQKHESRCLQALSSRLFVAFEDDTVPFGGALSEDLRAPSGAPFDHIVRITSHPRRVPGKALDIYLPPREHRHYLEDMERLSKDPELVITSKERRASSLDIDQLVMARDFIFNSSGTVLITAPRDARVEAMTVGLAFLAYSTGYGAREIMRNQNLKEARFKSIWQDVLNEHGLDICKRVAARRAVYHEDAEGLGYN